MPNAFAFTLSRVSSRERPRPTPGPEACDGPGPAASLMTVPGMGLVRRLAMTKAETGSCSSVLEQAARELEAAAHDPRVAFDCLALGELDRAHPSALTARVAADAAQPARQAGPL